MHGIQPAQLRQSCFFCNGEPLTTLLVLMVALAPVSDAVARVMLPLRNWTVPSATGSPVGVVTWVPYPSRWPYTSNMFVRLSAVTCVAIVWLVGPACKV